MLNQPGKDKQVVELHQFPYLPLVTLPPVWEDLALDLLPEGWQKKGA